MVIVPMAAVYDNNNMNCFLSLEGSYCITIIYVELLCGPLLLPISLWFKVIIW